MDNTLVLPVNHFDHFTYLGCHFDFKMKDEQHNCELIKAIPVQMEIIHKLTFHQKNKLKLYQQCTLSKISSHVTVIKISKTWVKNNTDKIESRYVRLWFEI